MATRDDFPEVIAALQLPAPRTPMFHFAVPLLYAGMGVALGTLTGMSLAFITAPGAITEAYNALIPSHSSAPDSAVDAAERAIWADNTSQVANTRANDARKHDVAASDSTPANLATDNAAAGQPAKTQNSTETQASPAKMPAVKESPVSPAAPERNHEARPVLHPFAKQARAILASVPEVSLDPQEDQQLSLVEGLELRAADAKSSHVYVEGDFTVTDYDASAGTIVTNDGKTFVIGSTVRTSNAATWDEYRASVHYRCGGNGTCTLTRAGTIALDARLI